VEGWIFSSRFCHGMKIVNPRVLRVLNLFSAAANGLTNEYLLKCQLILDYPTSAIQQRCLDVVLDELLIYLSIGPNWIYYLIVESQWFVYIGEIECNSGFSRSVQNSFPYSSPFTYSYILFYYTSSVNNLSHFNIFTNNYRSSDCSKYNIYKLILIILYYKRSTIISILHVKLYCTHGFK